MERDDLVVSENLCESVTVGEVFDYLVMLRDSGATNMYGSPPYIQQTFGVTRQEAVDLFVAWVETFK